MDYHDEPIETWFEQNQDTKKKVQLKRTISGMIVMRMWSFTSQN